MASDSGTVFGLVTSPRRIEDGERSQKGKIVGNLFVIIESFCAFFLRGAKALFFRKNY